MKNTTKEISDKLQKCFKAKILAGEPFYYNNITIVPVISLKKCVSHDTEQNSNCKKFINNNSNLGFGAYFSISPIAIFILKNDTVMKFILDDTSYSEEINKLLPEIYKKLHSK